MTEVAGGFLLLCYNTSMVCVRCQKPESLVKRWYKAPEGKICQTCYKKQWRHATGKTNTKWKNKGTQVTRLRDKHEKDKKIKESQVRDLLLHGASFSEIQSKLSLSKGALYRITREIVKEVKYTDRRKVVNLEARLSPKTSIVKPTGKDGKYLVRCNICDNIQSKTAHDLHYGCCKCSKTGTSGAEKELLEFISQFSLTASKYKLHDSRQEIDIFIPELKLGIEYCGLYWHCENSPTPRPRQYHINKMRLANTQGIRLITVFEDEWLERKDQVKGFIRSCLGSHDIRVKAKDCEVKEVDSSVGRKFYNEHHIQGQKTKSLVYIGLFYQSDLVAVVSGNSHHRGADKQSLVLDRLCFKSGVRIDFGSSRLFKALAKWAVKNGYRNILSWSDNRWSEGGVYKALGFELQEDLAPDYSYVKNGKRHSKQSLKKNPKKDDMTKTELELRSGQGFDRIWDCGKKRWVFML